MDTPDQVSRPAVQPTVSEIVLLPGETEWPTSLSAPSSSTLIKARTQLGLPADSPMIASGHQPIVFHPGIVAKLIAMDHWAKKTGSATVWIVPDQDVLDPALIRVPGMDGDVLTVTSIRLGGEPNELSPVAIIPPIAVRQDLPEELESIGTWLMGYEHESSLARQFASATIGMVCERLGIDEPRLMYASELLGIEAGSVLIDAMLDEPRRAIESYNRSVARFSDAGVRPMSISDDRIELPLWRLEDGGRSPVFVDPAHIEGVDRSNLIPRGLLMTGVMRSVFSDLFIHGTGGDHYDHITEHWFLDWLGQPLAPAVAVSATMRLGFDLPTTLDPDRAMWNVHHARHDPAMLGDESAAQKKTDIVNAINASKSKDDHAQSARLYTELHKLLSRVRVEHAQKLAEFDAAAERAQHARQTLALANDRTWAFPLYSDAQLQILKAEIVGALDGTLDADINGSS